MIQRIRTLHTDGLVEVRWATTWVDHIDQITAIMHLPTWQPAFTLTHRTVTPTPPSTPRPCTSSRPNAGP